MNTDLSILLLPTRTENILRSVGVITVDQLCGLSSIDLLKIENFGKGSLSLVKNALLEHGLHLSETSGLNFASLTARDSFAKSSDDVDDIADEIRSLIKYAEDRTKESILHNPETLAKLAFDSDAECLIIVVEGFYGPARKSLPLTIHVTDAYTPETPLFSFDPIQQLIEACESDPNEAWTKEAIVETIASLEHGIARLRAYETERLKTQSES